MHLCYQYIPDVDAWRRDLGEKLMQWVQLAGVAKIAYKESSTAYIFDDDAAQLL